MKKIINTKKIENLEVWTDDGWQDITNIHTTIKYEQFILRTENIELHCADNHIVFDSEYNEIIVKDLKIGDIIQTENGLENVLEVFNTKILKEMYDLEVDSEKHRYYTNGVLSHNTSLLNILTENTDFRMLKSDERGVDTIEIIEEHCKNFSIPLKKKGQKGNPRGQKVIWLEEFDKTSAKFREALRSFMEEYPEVRFVATLNDLPSINRTDNDQALIGRFNMLDFEPNTQEEKDYLRDNYFKYLKAVGKNSSLEMNDEIYYKIIDSMFPNLRAAVQIIQEIVISGSYEQFEDKKEHYNQDVFTFLLDGNNDLKYNFFYVSENFPKNKTEDLLHILSRPFFKYLIENRPEVIEKNGMKIANLSKNYNYQYTLTIDPEMHLFNYITQLKHFINEC